MEWQMKSSPGRLSQLLYPGSLLDESPLGGREERVYKYMFIIYSVKGVKASRASRGQATMKSPAPELFMCPLFAPQKPFLFL
jgi:hypothetical protein